MRVLRTFVTSLLALGIIAGVVGLIAREVLLVMGVGVVREAITELRSTATKQGGYIQECIKKGAVDSNSPVSAVQLRFTSDTEFVTEVVCSQSQLDSIVTSRQKLPWMVRKVIGNSGIVWGDERSGVTLEIWGRRRAIIVENRDVEYSSDPEVDLGAGPITTCSGFGAACCSLDAEVGVGDQWTEATDCPKSCYASCTPRPVVLSISTDPYYELETRRASIQSGQTMTFTLLIEANQATPAKVTVDYGDGQVGTGDEHTENYQHTYQCTTGTCEYPVKVKVVDSHGVSSAETLSSNLVVVVSQ